MRGEIKASIAAITAAVMLVGCASKGPANASAPDEAAAKAAKPPAMESTAAMAATRKREAETRIIGLRL